ncbi:pyridine nucleotide-disulfide oxidoreductase domain-containing protein 1-like [Ciona intestinalis]
MGFRFVVIGGGIAGVSCAESLLAHSPDANVCLISPTPIIKAARNVNELTKNLVTFDVTEIPVTEYESKHPNVKVHKCSAVRINTEDKLIFMSNGDKLSYDKVCVCTGARQNVIFPENNRVVGIRDTATAMELDKMLQSSERVVVVGNGGIATELVFQIKNCEVIWAIKDKSISNVFFDGGAGQFFLPFLQRKKDLLKNVETEIPSKRMIYKVSDFNTTDGKTLGGALGPDWHQSLSLTGTNDDICGVNVEYECEVHDLHVRADNCCHLFEAKKASGEHWPLHVKLSNDVSHACDFVISATGVVPNVQVFSDLSCTFALDGGIEVDENMRVIGLYDVYAAGDVCSTTKWPKSPHWHQMRLWTQARQMGLFAAQCMSGHSTQQQNIPLDICFELFAHVTSFFGKKVVLLGNYNAQKNNDNKDNLEFLLRVEMNEEYVKVVLFNGRIIGCVLIGETDLEETFENLILNQTDVSALGENLLDPNVDIADYFD